MSLFSNEEVAIITGASSGIGAGTAVVLTRKGVTKFCLTGRNVEGLKETKRKCMEECGSKIKEDDILLVDGDLTCEDVCKRIVAATVDQFGRIDILVNNAGICPTGQIDTTPVSQFDNLVNTNVRSMVVLTQLCVPQLKAHKGTIVNVSSILGVLPIPMLGFYSMSKAAMDMYTRSLSLELASEGIRVNSVNPGPIPTSIGIRQGMSEEEYAKLIEDMRGKVPLGKVGSVEDVGYAVAFLASKEASFINGALLPVDGGWLNHLA